MGASRSWREARPGSGAANRGVVAFSIVALFAVLMIAPVPAFAGQASSGKLLFYPCTSCHPVTVNAAGQSSHPIPNTFKGHGIVLEGHDKVGVGSAACLVCHDDASRNPGKLKAADGTLIDITGDVSLVCLKCHEEKYHEFKAGTHGKHQVSCVAAGCHDPHSPQYIYVPPLTPFQGTGFQIKVLPVRVAFKPFASPPPAPRVFTPSWYAVGAIVAYALALLLAAGLVYSIVRGRQDR